MDQIQISIAERLKFFRERRGLGQRQLSRMAGLPEYTVRRIEVLEGDLDASHVAKLALALRVPEDALRITQHPAWQSADYTNRQRLEDLFNEIQAAKTCLAATTGLDSYLLSDEMLIWASERSLSAASVRTPDTVGARAAEWRDYGKRQQEVRRNSTFLHRILAPASFFRAAFTVDSNWIDLTRTAVRSYDEVTALGLVPDAHWHILDKTVQRATLFRSWDKTMVVDDELLVVRPSRELFLWTYHPPAATAVRLALEKCGALVPYSFPAGDELTPTKFGLCTERTLRALHETSRACRR